MSLRWPSTILLGATLLLLGGAVLLSCGPTEPDAAEDLDRVVHWLDERDDVAGIERVPAVGDDGGYIEVRLRGGRSDDDVWSFVDDFQRFADPLDVPGAFEVDVDGFRAHLAPVVWDGGTRGETDGDLVRALWLRADGRATGAGDGGSLSVSTLVTAAAADVAPLALDLQALDVDTGDSIRVASPDGSIGVEWTSRLDFGVDLVALRGLVSLQERFPRTRGWVSGAAGESELGVVFSPEDISLDRLRREVETLFPRRAGARDRVGWGTLVTDVESFRAVTGDAATRRAYEELARVPGLVPAQDTDVVATDLAGFRAAHRVLRQHPRASLSSIGYAPVPAPFLGVDRPLVLESVVGSKPDRLTVLETVIGLPDVAEFTPYRGRLVVTAGIDDEQLRTALRLMTDLVPPDVAVTASIIAERTGVPRWLGSAELSPGRKIVRGAAQPGEKTDDRLLDRIEVAWAELTA